MRGRPSPALSRIRATAWCLPAVRQSRPCPDTHLDLARTVIERPGPAPSLTRGLTGRRKYANSRIVRLLNAPTRIQRPLLRIDAWVSSQVSNGCGHRIKLRQLRKRRRFRQRKRRPLPSRLKRKAARPPKRLPLPTRRSLLRFRKRCRKRPPQGRSRPLRKRISPQPDNLLNRTEPPHTRP